MPESLTKYEKARVIGARALQIAMGAPFLIKFSKKQIEEMRYNPVEIAKFEYAEDVIPIAVKRRLPNVTAIEVKKPENKAA
ncbi:MAG: DNA-directed RNA polymerase subunit K [Nanoarchaeota archaeon]